MTLMDSFPFEQRRRCPFFPFFGGLLGKIDGDFPGQAAPGKEDGPCPTRSI
jgi:hypothetical protein